MSGNGIPVMGAIPMFMPTLTKIWNKKATAIRAGDNGPVTILRERHDAQRPPDEQGVKGQNERGAHESVALANDRKDEVGVALGQEAVPRLRRLVAAAGLATGADGDEGLIDLIAGACRVLAWREE